MPRRTVGQLLMVFGVSLLAVAAVWTLTGDIDRPGVQLRMGGGWRGFTIAVIGGAAAIVVGRRLVRDRGPAA